METNEIDNQIYELIDAWCERRNLKALGLILPGYPVGQGLTDDVYRVLNALKEVRAFAKETLTEKEMNIIEHLIIGIEQSLPLI